MKAKTEIAQETEKEEDQSQKAHQAHLDQETDLLSEVTLVLDHLPVQSQIFI